MQYSIIILVIIIVLIVNILLFSIIFQNTYNKVMIKKSYDQKIFGGPENTSKTIYRFPFKWHPDIMLNTKTRYLT